jgi:hypothetical protein
MAQRFKPGNYLAKIGAGNPLAGVTLKDQLKLLNKLSCQFGVIRDDGYVLAVLLGLSAPVVGSGDDG